MFFVNRDWMECPIFHLNYLSHLCRVWIRSWGKGYQGRLSTPSLWREILSRERSKGQGLLRKVNHVSHLCEEKWLVEATVVLKKTEHFSRKTFLTENYVLYTKTVFFFCWRAKKAWKLLLHKEKKPNASYVWSYCTILKKFLLPGKGFLKQLK